MAVSTVKLWNVTDRWIRSRVLNHRGRPCLRCGAPKLFASNKSSPAVMCSPMTSMVAPEPSVTRSPPAVQSVLNFVHPTAKRRRKSISREQADVGPPVVEAVVARKVAAEIDRPVTGLRAAVVAVSDLREIALQAVLAETVRRATALRVVVEVSGRLAVRVAEDRLAMLLAARQLQNSIRRLVI